MVRPLQDLYADISQLPRHQRLEIARFVLNFEEPLQNQDIELQWDQEIRNRIKAFDEGLLETIDYEQVQSELNRRFEAEILNLNLMESFLAGKLPL